MCIVHISAIGRDSSASVGSVWAASMDLHHWKVQVDCQPVLIRCILNLSKQSDYLQVTQQ
jgi:hypothetical protein